MHPEQGIENQGATEAPPLPAEGLKALVESLLFVADGPVPLAKLARTLHVEREAVEATLASLNADYAGRGLRLQRLDGRVQMVTAPEATPYVESFLGLGGESHLSGAALETLAIVAYRQPITRAGIEAVRGVNCDRVVLTLQTRGLIEEVGRAETAGRPVLFGTTFAFLEYFGLTDLAALPPLAEGLPGGAGLVVPAPQAAKAPALSEAKEEERNGRDSAGNS